MWIVPKYGVFTGLYIPVFSANTENTDQRNSGFGHFSCSERWNMKKRIMRSLIMTKLQYGRAIKIFYMSNFPETKVHGNSSAGVWSTSNQKSSRGNLKSVKVRKTCTPTTPCCGNNKYWLSDHLWRKKYCKDNCLKNRNYRDLKLL